MNDDAVKIHKNISCILFILNFWGRVGIVKSGCENLFLVIYLNKPSNISS